MIGWRTLASTLKITLSERRLFLSFTVVDRKEVSGRSSMVGIELVVSGAVLKGVGGTDADAEGVVPTEYSEEDEGSSASGGKGFEKVVSEAK